MGISSLVLILILSFQLIPRAVESYTGSTHIRIRWHIRNMMQALVYDGFRRAETVYQFTRFYERSDQWYTGKLTALIRSKAERMWRLLERGYRQREQLDIHMHVMILDEMTGLGIEVDKLTEVMEEYLAAGGREGIRAAKKASKAALKTTSSDQRRHLEQIIRQNDPGFIDPVDVKGLNQGEKTVLRMMQTFQRSRAGADRARHRQSPLDNGGFESAEYHNYEGFQ